MDKKMISPRHEGLKWLLSSVAFMLVFVLLLVNIGGVMQQKSGRKNVVPLYENSESYDVILAGTSHVVSSLFPMVMWENNGITAVNFAQTGQPFPLTYYSIKEAIDVAAPEMVVVDLYYIYQGNQYAGNESYKHQTLDNFRVFSPAKIQAVFETIKDADAKVNFLFPFFAYHSRWTELAKTDFTKADILSKGAGEIFSVAEEPLVEPFEPIDVNDTKKPKPAMIDYIDRIIALCKEKDVKLMFTVVPYYPVGFEQERDLADDQRLFNWVTQYVEKQGVECLNMLYKVEEMGFAMDKYMREWNHQNYWGGEVTSKYLANYLQENYGIADHRGEAGYEKWNEDFAAYDAWRQKQLDAFEKKNTK